MYVCVSVGVYSYTVLLQVVLSTDDIELAGNIIQAFTEDLGIEVWTTVYVCVYHWSLSISLQNLQSRANFPKSMEELRQILEKVR